MKTIYHPKLARRDRCYLIGKRGLRLDPTKAAEAWYRLSTQLAEKLSEKDIPKFNDLLAAVHASAIVAAKIKVPEKKPLTHPALAV